jgi:hypothetical protein
MINLNIIFTCILFVFSAVSHAGRDHAPIYGPRNIPSRSDKILHKLGVDRDDYTRHESAAEDFKDRYFRDPTSKKITLEKTEMFLEKLQNEYYALKNRSYETKFLEQLDVAKTSAKKAQKEAVKPNVSKNVLAPYELYLIPKINEIIVALNAAQNNDTVEGLLDDFVRGYVPYYNPNPFNARYANKVNAVGGMYHVPKHPERNENTDKVQANNLLVKSEQQRKDINHILKVHHRRVKVGDFLTNDDIVALLEKKYDISKLDPGESAFWEELTAQEKKAIFYRDRRFFPGEKTKIIFDRVLYGGSNSPKVRIKFKNKYGVYMPAKLKVGTEVSSELASGALMRLLGFNADKMIYTGTVKMHLKGKTFENFEAEMRQKFGQYQNVRYNYERGVDERGETFLTWRDTLVEARPVEELRIGPLDIASWDLQNRREYRGSMLAIAWLGINDLKMDNKKALLVKRGETWIPQHRIHDTGISLGPTFAFTGLESILNLPAPYAKVNQLETKIVKKTSGGVEIFWNDFCFQYRQYGSSTYYDHKWMARKIAALSKNDIAESLLKSGMPTDLAHLFWVKMIMRRNNIVRTFDLQDEYELYDEPENIKKYSPEAYGDIKKGEINKTAYENKNIIPIRIRTWGSLISTLIAGQLPFGDFTKSFETNHHQVIGTLKGGAVQMDYQWNKEGHNIGPFGKLYLQPGITLIPSRQVTESPQNLNTTRIDKHGKPVKDKNGAYVKTHLPYMVIDQVKIVVAVALGAEQTSYLPLYGGASAKLIEKTITHRHFTETIKDAWLSAFKIPQIIVEGKKKFSARHLGDLETVESFYSIGLSASVQIGTNWAKDIAENGFSIDASARKISNKLIYRDQFGRLHYVKEKVKNRSINAKIDFIHGEVKLFDYSAFGVQLSSQKFSGELVDYIIGQNDPLALQTHDHEVLTKEKSAREIKAFDDMKHNLENAEVMLNFSRVAQAGTSHKRLSLLFVVSNEKIKDFGEVEDTLINGQVRKLFHASVYSGKHLGKKSNIGFSEVTDIAVLNGKSKKTIVEVEKRAPEKFTILVSSRVFARKTDHDGLMEIIKKLNARYGDNHEIDRKNQFFADLELPAEDEQDTYRKIYADMRVLVDGEYLLKKIANTNEEDIKAMLDEFFNNDAINIRKARYEFDEDGTVNLKDSKPSANVRLANDVISVHKRQKIIGHFKKLKKLLAEPGENTDWKSVWLSSRDLVHELSSHYYGAHILRRFLNIHENYQKDQAILVYGEIRNIGDHIATLERPHGHHANMRSTGAHWGKYQFGKDKVRPIQYYLKFEDPTNQLPIYWAFNLHSNQILGRLEQGQPPNFTGEGI